VVHPRTRATIATTSEGARRIIRASKLVAA
jgi:hypothetical protein